MDSSGNRTLKNFPETLTRRSNLSYMSRLYDSLGLLVPFTLKAKLLMREICISSDTQNSNWDTSVSDIIYKKSKDFYEELLKIEDTRFDRSLKPKNAVGSPILIIFCDGSKNAFVACSYIRWRLQDGTYRANLVCAKNRLAPLKTMTIPRIELCGAVLTCRMRETIMKEMDFKFSEIYHITDSSIVRDQIQKDSYLFGVFAANRVAEIQNSSQPTEWWWTESSNNIADLTTRAVGICKLDDKWKHGPEYLEKDVEYWPITQDIRTIPSVIDASSKEYVVEAHVIQSKHRDPINLSIIDRH